jgi:hypothetical protein
VHIASCLTKEAEVSDSRMREPMPFICGRGIVISGFKTQSLEAKEVHFSKLGRSGLRIYPIRAWVGELVL